MGTVETAAPVPLSFHLHIRPEGTVRVADRRYSHRVNGTDRLDRRFATHGSKVTLFFTFVIFVSLSGTGALE